ncbi:hypothetical protein [Ochrobactrum soli]|uniref:Uncharacterized protein n=1 Tax=Ochrobactrum soli TaxID=2448455 RepID=A0A849KX21_9HYPH|nr:hypothetical protein [[Ochrobactrum] soli]NNU62424.1 hypothetical protein [[Ochrobactrum] soli]
MGWIPDKITAAMRGSFLLGIFLRIETDPALHVWFGINDIPAGFDSLDEDGTVYLGAGRLIGVPTLEVLVGGQADSVEFTISGIDPDTATKALDSLPPVRGARCFIGITTLDEYYQPMSSIIPLWWGIASHVNERSEVVTRTDNQTITLGLSVATGGVTRSRPARAEWTDVMQRQISPDDGFCKQVSRLARGVAPIWPNY